MRLLVPSPLYITARAHTIAIARDMASVFGCENEPMALPGRSVPQCVNLWEVSVAIDRDALSRPRPWTSRRSAGGRFRRHP